MTSRPRSKSTSHTRRLATFLAIITLAIPFITAHAAPPRIALLIDANTNVDPIPSAFDQNLTTNLAPADLLDLDQLSPLLAGGPSLAQQLREQSNFAAADFRFNQNGVQGRMPLLADPDPFLAYDLTITNTADRTLSLFLVLNLPIEPLNPSHRIAAELQGQISDNSNSSPTNAILTYQQSILFDFADDPSLIIPIRLSGEAVPNLPILESIPTTTIPTAQPVTAIALQNLLTLTPGHTAHLTGHLAAGNTNTPLLDPNDIQLLLNNATIPEPATAMLVIPTLALLSHRKNHCKNRHQ